MRVEGGGRLRTHGTPISACALGTPSQEELLATSRRMSQPMPTLPTGCMAGLWCLLLNGTFGLRYE